jgi:excisionase family DNA binding protein
MENLTFEKLPHAVYQLSNEIGEIKQLLHGWSNPKYSEPDRWFDLSELCNYHPDKPSKATVYGWVSMGLIPCHKGGKKLRFLKSEIDNWLKQGRKKTLNEAAAEAEAYLKKKGGCHA